MRAPRNWSPWVYSAGIGTASRSRPAPASEWHNVRVAYCVRVGECGIEHLGERYPARRDTQRVEKSPYGLLGADDRAVRIEAAQVDVELPAGEAAGPAVGPV